MPSVNPFKNRTLGIAKINNPLPLSSKKGDNLFTFIEEDNQILLDSSLHEFQRCIQDKDQPLALEKAGPRKKLFFQPDQVTAAIVTCGGLCPGINNVIRSLVMGLHYFYGVRRILGVPYGYEGLTSKRKGDFLQLTPDLVNDIHQFGGTILGSSRGAQDLQEMVETLKLQKIDILFTIGGDGTLKGSEALGAEIEKQGLSIAVVGIPKTIDNDIDLIDKSFGFETAFDVATPIIRDAHNEATGAHNGIAIVKLMGRDSGFIAASAAISMPVVNFVLVPEMSFSMHGEKGFLKALEDRLIRKQHAVIVVAEGAGQHLFEGVEKIKDASGNIKHSDIGILLKEEIGTYFRKKDIPVTIKYIDPSYIIRSAPANSGDSVFCNRLAFQAVHGAMAGKTRFVVGMIHNQLVYLPIERVVNRRKKIDMEGDFWYATLQSTGQPLYMD